MAVSVAPGQSYHPLLLNPFAQLWQSRIAARHFDPSVLPFKPSFFHPYRLS